MFKKTKELQSLVEATRKSLGVAESKIEEREKFILAQKEENTILYNEKKELETEIADLKDILNEIANLSTKNQCGNERIIIAKIKELVTDYQSKN